MSSPIERDGLWLRVGRWWYHPTYLGRVPDIRGGTAVFALTQHNYRFYEDDGAETAQTPIAAEVTAISRDVVSGNSVVVLRIGFNETGSGNASGNTTDDYQLQYSKNGGAFTNVTGASSNVRGFASANLTDQGAATQQLTGGAGTFSGEIAEDGLIDDHQIIGNGCGEFLYPIELVAADLADGDALTFRVLKNGATTNMTYSVTPTINVQKVAGAPDYLKTDRRRPTRRRNMNPLLVR